VDAKLAAYTARKMVDLMISDPNTSPELKRILTQLMGADLKTLEHRRSDTETARNLIERMGGDDTPCDLLTVVDADGTRRYLLFI
jgi:hypothetical protein